MPRPVPERKLRPMCRTRSAVTATARGGLAAVVLALAGPPAWAADHLVVTTDAMRYSPSSLTIAAGDTVTFRNDSGGFHDVHADDDSFRCANGCDGHGGDGNPSYDTWSATVAFNNAGTVTYHCDIHGPVGMVGSITVTGGGGPLGAPTRLAAAAVDSG